MRRPPIVAVPVLAAALVGAGCQSPFILLRGPDTPDEVPSVAWRPDGIAPGAPNRLSASCDTLVPVQQESAEWCWAACAQMLHAVNGRTLSQAELARRIHGEGAGDPERGRAAAYHEIVQSLLEVETDVPFEHFVAPLLAGRSRVALDTEQLRAALVGFFAPNSDLIVSELQQGRPVLVVLDDELGPDGLQHACVLSSVTYAVEHPSLWLRFVEALALGLQDVVGWSPLDLNALPKRYSLDHVVLVDPAAVTPRVMNGSEFERRVRFVVSRHSARALVRDTVTSLDLQDS